MKKRILSSVLVFGILAALTLGMPAVASAASGGTCGENLTWTLDDDGTLTISGSGEMTDWSYSNVPWYSSMSSIISVEIGNGVTSIGNYAFNCCDSLKSVSIPDGVTSIGNWAFSNCHSLTSVTIPDSVLTICDCAFYGCIALSSLEIGNSVTAISYEAFHGCGSLTSVTIPDSVTSIGDDAFFNCRSLTSVTIPSSVTSIGSRAFYGTSIYDNDENRENGVLYIDNCLIEANCDVLYGEYSIKNNTRLIGDAAFFECTGLTSVIIPNGVTSIGNEAFSNCYGLTSVTIPDSVTSIGRLAFYECTGLTDVEIGNGVISIGDSAFCNCESLSSLKIPDSVTSIGEDVIYNTLIYNDGSWEEAVLYIDNCLIKTNCDDLSEEYVIKNNTRLIGDGAFSRCIGLTSLTIPDSVTIIGNMAFDRCRNLTDVYYTGSEEQWEKINMGSDNDCLTSAAIHYAKDGDAQTPALSVESVTESSVLLKALNCTALENAAVILVVYNENGSMAQMKREAFANDITFTGLTLKSGYLKAMLWESVEKPLPLVKAAEYTFNFDNAK